MRILLKISGEMLSGDKSFGIDDTFVKYVASELKKIKETGIEVSIVLGAGNIIRGASGGSFGINRAEGDNMGMLATTINSIYLGEALESIGIKTKVLNSIDISGIGEKFSVKKAEQYLKDGYVNIFSGGTGNPYFTTDTAGVLRALEINSDILIKATKVNGVYDKDPQKFNDALFIKEATYDEVIKNNLKVMDMTAIIMAKENNLKIKVVNLKQPGAILKAINGFEGTTIS